MDFGHGRRDRDGYQYYRDEDQEDASSYPQFTHSSSSASSSSSSHWVPVTEAVEPRAAPVEKEHMFDKVLTPSDVGKLNRLVIPKQHAEKYFPLDLTAAERGLQLSFQDRAGKPWRFRYSYWNSSQSYVMTKGWSRFIKEKRLGAGDTVSFFRGIGEAGRGSLFIEWRRRRTLRPVPALPFATANFPAGGRPWGSYLPPLAPAMLNFYSHPQVHLQVGASRGRAVPVMMNSVPVVPAGKNESKRVRLFGVNLECSEQQDGGEAGRMQLVQIMPPPTPLQWGIGLVESTVASPGSVLQSPIDLHIQLRDKEEGRR